MANASSNQNYQLEGDAQLNLENEEMLQDFFGEGIKDIYYAEKHIINTLPGMIEVACSPILKTAFEEHIEVSKNQVARLEKVFELTGIPPEEKKCEAIEGIIKESKTIIEDTNDGTATRDVGLILAAQRIEHYEIASYGGLAHVATTLGMHEVAELLNASLNEEKEADVMFSNIAVMM